MKRLTSDLAVFGGPVEFADVLHVGQINIPEKERFEAIFSGIFSRRYYTNHGPLQQELEVRLEDLFRVRNAIAVTNATIGLMLACKALGLREGGRVIVPAFTFAASVQALSWAGLMPLFCDVDPDTHVLSVESVRAALEEPGVCAILGVHLWGTPCGVEELRRLADERGIKVFYDAAHAIGNTINGLSVGNFGDLEVFSFHATKIFSSGEGGCVTTNDDELAERLRNLRSSYGRRMDVPVPIGGYGRFSEAQAALGLLSLEDFAANCEMNGRRFGRYRERLADVPGLRFILPPAGERSNSQYVVLEVDEALFGLSRDAIVKCLQRENILCRRYFTPGMHRCLPYSSELPQYVESLPVTDFLCSRVMQLPSGQQMDDNKIDAVCDLIIFLHENAENIAGRLCEQQ